jgi:hypothetical protein
MNRVHKQIIVFLTAMIAPIFLFSSPLIPLETDYAIFLFDNGEKNMIASMLKYAEENDRSTLDNLDFRIVFMGAAVDAMDKEPFSHYPEKLIYYKQLGIEETVDHQWKRDRRLGSDSLNRLAKNLSIRKKLWVGVSSSIFEQIVLRYQDSLEIEVVALRDNPSSDGDTDYFRIAQEVQNAAHKIAVPSKAISCQLDSSDKQAVVIGHAPIEEWKAEAETLDKEAILRRMGLNPQLPIIMYAGVYGDFYQPCFEKFLDIVPDKNVQVLIVPHPRYKGAVEIPLCENAKRKSPYFKIVGEFIEDVSRKIKTVEALSVADIVVTADATSTVVFQANALGKKVLYVNPVSSGVSKAFTDIKLIYPLCSREEFVKLVNSISKENKTPSGHLDQDVFDLLGIPKQGAKLLWEEWLKQQKGSL